MINEYDNKEFFEKYNEMDRSVKGLAGAGEWHELKKLLPSFEGKTVLDIGCGFGWHCKYAIENGATNVLGIDISKNMLNKAKQINNDEKIEYRECSIEEFDYPLDTYDIIISSLALHYIENLNEVFKKVYKSLKENGSFVFSMEHPIFTSNGIEDWEYNEDGSIKCWPIDNYFYERKISSNFLNCDVIKYHKTLTTIINELIDNGFTIKKIVEPMPEENMLKEIEQMKHELRRPMMIIVSTIK